MLSVAVSCKGSFGILRKNLSALSRQSLSRELWSLLFLFREQESSSECVSLIYEFFPSAQILFLPKGSPIYEMKSLALSKIASPYIYFIDEDVILEDFNHLSRLIELHKKHSSATALGGGYLDHLECSFLGKCYNWIARLWIKNQAMPPAGNLSVKTEKAFKARFYSPGPFGFGGEEAHFLRSLQAEGHKLLLDRELDAQHLARHNLKDFIKRAWLHGASQAFEKSLSRTSYALFLKEPAPLSIKATAFLYLLLVRFTCALYKIKKRWPK